MNTKNRVWCIELMRKHIRLKKFRYSVIIVITTLLLAVAAITYVAVSNESTLQVIRKITDQPAVNDFEKLTSKDFFDEMMIFLKFGTIGKIIKFLVILWGVFIVVCICTPTKLMRKCIYSQYEKLVLRPVASNNMIHINEYTYSDGNIKATYKGDELTQVNVIYDEKENFMGRFLTIEGNRELQEPIWITGRYFGEYSPMEPDGDAIYLKDAAFGEHYTVVGDEESVKNILTQELMEHLVAMSETYKKIAFKITKDKLIIAYDTEKDAFRLALKKAVRYDDVIVEVKKDIKFITDAIEINNLLKGK